MQDREKNESKVSSDKILPKGKIMPALAYTKFCISNLIKKLSKLFVQKANCQISNNSLPKSWFRPNYLVQKCAQIILHQPNFSKLFGYSEI